MEAGVRGGREKVEGGKKESVSIGLRHLSPCVAINGTSSLRVEHVYTAY